jgi:hypothetical protein
MFNVLDFRLFYLFLLFFVVSASSSLALSLSLLYCGLTLMPGGTSLRGRWVAATGAGFSRPDSMSLRGRAGDERDDEPADWADWPDVELRGRLRKRAVSSRSLSSLAALSVSMLWGRETERCWVVPPAENGCMPAAEPSVGDG